MRTVATNNLEIRQNLFEHVGGAGMVIGANSSNILIEYNTTNYTGSSIDSRMAGRGSGLWCFRTRNLTAQHNRFMHARGIKDSFGMHIDIGNTNVVYQYNYSEDNEGGFAEILGDNRNVGYRYNLSIGDGWRSRGSQLGRIFWVGGWSGNPSSPSTSDSVFIYNNSVIVRDTISPRIWIEAVTGRTRIYNNIVFAPNGLAEVFIKNPPSNNDFNNNLWFGPIPTMDTDGQAYRGSQAITSNPLFMTINVSDSSDFVLQSTSPALEAGKLIYDGNPPTAFNYYSNHGGKDYYGHPVSNSVSPNIGAYNWIGDVISHLDREDLNKALKIFPNPIQIGEPITLKLPKDINPSPVSVDFLDMSRRVLKNVTSSFSETLTIDTQNFSIGIYIITVTMDDLRISRQVLLYE